MSFQNNNSGSGLRDNDVMLFSHHKYIKEDRYNREYKGVCRNMDIENKPRTKREIELWLKAKRQNKYNYYKHLDSVLKQERTGV